MKDESWLEDAAREVARLHRTAEAKHTEAMEAFRATGRVLLRVKEQLGHGPYQKWVAAHLEMFGMGSVRRAGECTQLAELRDAEARLVAHLSPGAALRELRNARPSKQPVVPESAPRSFTTVDLGRPITGDRPPYCLPLLRDLRAAPSHAGTVISTFAGAGGSSLGFEAAGFQPRAAVEFIDSAATTYEANHPGVPVIARDIREVTGADLLSTAGLDVGELDVLDGSPPCAGYSPAGRGQRPGEVRPYSETRQRVDDLLGEFARLVAEVKPRTFVVENVPNLARPKHLPALRAFATSLDGAYDIAIAIVQAEWLGVPQRRDRLIIVGLRGDLMKPVTGVTAAACVPKPQPWRYTLREALAALPEADEQERADRAAASIERFAIGEEWRLLKPGGASPRNRNLIRPHLDAPCPTVTATAASVGAAGVTHPFECRKFTPRELLAVSGFPLDYRLKGTLEQRSERIGRAVPPLMMHAVAKAVGTVLERAEPSITEPDHGA